MVVVMGAGLALMLFVLEEDWNQNVVLDEWQHRTSPS